MSFYLKPEYAGTAYRASERTPENAYPRKSLQERGHRFYSPSLSRWLSRDPAGTDGGINLHTFSDNSPVSNVDPRGLAACNLSCCDDACPKTHPRTDLPLKRDDKQWCSGSKPMVKCVYPASQGSAFEMWCSVDCRTGTGCGAGAGSEGPWYDPQRHHEPTWGWKAKVCCRWMHGWRRAFGKHCYIENEYGGSSQQWSLNRDTSPVTGKDYTWVAADQYPFPRVCREYELGGSDFLRCLDSKCRAAQAKDNPTADDNDGLVYSPTSNNSNHWVNRRARACGSKCRVGFDGRGFSSQCGPATA